MTEVLGSLGTGPWLDIAILLFTYICLRLIALAGESTTIGIGRFLVSGKETVFPMVSLIFVYLAHSRTTS